MLSDKYKKLNTKINKWFANKEQDIDILTSLYNQCNLEENSLIDRSENIKKNTMFSDLTNEELFAKFEKEHFTELTDKELKHLFQEAHNRFIKENGLDVTRNIVVEEDSPNNKYRGGYVRYSDDLLFLNKSLINQGNKTKDLNKFYNERSIGKIFLCTLFHETKHVIQYEDAIDFALGNKQEKDRALVH